MKYQVEITFFIENYRKIGMVIKFRLPLIFVQGGRKLNGANKQCKGAKIKWAKIKWSENLNEAKFEKSKVVLN